jgi:hypothetical protein
MLPPLTGAVNVRISEKYRAKALDCESRGQLARDVDVKAGWAEIAIEWHALSFRTSEAESLDCEFDDADMGETVSTGRSIGPPALTSRMTGPGPR